MSYPCPRCGTRLVEDPDDEVSDYELEGAQVRHTVARCREAEVLRGEAVTPARKAYEQGRRAAFEEVQAVLVRPEVWEERVRQALALVTEYLTRPEG